MTVFQKMVVESILPNQIKWYWYHSFQKTMFYLIKSKYAIFLNINVTKIKQSSLLGTPSIESLYLTGWIQKLGNELSFSLWITLEKQRVDCVKQEKIAGKLQLVIFKHHRNCSLSELHEKLPLQNIQYLFIQFQGWVMFLLLYTN